VYAYLLSALPSFELDDEPPMTLAELLERCRGFVPDAELAALRDPESAANGTGAAAAVARRWRDAERQLRNGVVRRRAPFWQLEAADHMQTHAGFRAMIEEGVAHAFEASDPQARQRELDMLRWQLLDELAGPVPWGFSALFAYSQRLRLAREWAAREASAGRDALGRVLDTVEEQHG